MTKLPQEAKKYIELHTETSNRILANEIFQKLNIKTTHTTVGKEKKEILERVERKVERIEVEKPILTPRPFIPKRVPREDYQLATKGILEDMVREALRGEIPIKSKLRKRMKKGYPEEPFEGNMKGAGGWNSITYAVFNVLISSKRVYIKKES